MTVPLVMNSLVERNISFFQGAAAAHGAMALNVGKYFPLMPASWRRKGCPRRSST